jgi:hypothetical protein
MSEWTSFRMDGRNKYSFGSMALSATLVVGQVILVYFYSQCTSGSWVGTVMLLWSCVYLLCLLTFAIIFLSNLCRGMWRRSAFILACLIMMTSPLYAGGFFYRLVDSVAATSRTNYGTITYSGCGRIPNDGDD